MYFIALYVQFYNAQIFYQKQQSKYLILDFKVFNIKAYGYYINFILDC
jgi:hypothetical protein